jgi:hypothetical protein
MSADGTASVSVASAADTLALTRDVILPTLAKGPIIRRRWAVGVAERHDLVGRAVRRMQRLHERYGDGPLLMRVPVRKQAVLLAPDDVRRVLDGSPEPFAADSSEKRASLSHFNPKTVLISRGEDRADRRRFNEAVLDTGCPMHRLAERFHTVVEEESGALLARARRADALDWEVFGDAWFCVVRRVVLGDAARDDRAFTRLHERLRAYANLAFVQPIRHELRERFLTRLNQYLDDPEPGSLAAIMGGTPTTPRTAPDHQPPHWMFAADPAGMTVFRTLALLAVHPEHEERARAEAAGGDPSLPFLRRCVLETLRLWPTTPMILRESRSDTRWDSTVLPAGTGILIYAPFFHRDDRHLPFAHRFAPEVWEPGGAAAQWSFVPFSAGPVRCPAEQLVLMLTSSMLAALLRGARYRERHPAKLAASTAMPSTLDNYTLRFGLEA